MPGPQSSYNAANADFVIRYAEHPGCIARLWMPEGYRTLTDMPVFIALPGGGWDAPHRDFTASIHEPYQDLVAGGTGSLPTRLLEAGWVYVRADYPWGTHATPRNRVHPPSRWPDIPRSIGRLVQYLKTHAINGRITGSTSSTLAQKASRYVLSGDSAGGIEALYVAFQPDGWLPYGDRFTNTGGQSPWNYRFNHRVRGVMATDAGCDFTKWQSDAVSADALPRFGPREMFYVNPAFGQVDPWQKRDSSPLPYVEANLAENKHIGIFQDMNEGSITSGQGDPVEGALGSYLGSGTVVTSLSITGTYQVGETVTGSGGGTGTLKGTNTTGSTKYLYIERTTTAVFSGTVTGATSGATCTVGGCSGNNNRLAFLTYDQALALWDAAGTYGELTDCRAVHEQTHGAALKRACDRNDAVNGTSLHRHYLGNDYVAGISGHEPSFQWGDGTFTDALMDWLSETLGIETDV